MKFVKETLLSQIVLAEDSLWVHILLINVV